MMLDLDECTHNELMDYEKTFLCHLVILLRNFIHEASNGKKRQKKIRKSNERVMKEFKEGELHSGSKKGPKVKKASQAKAIAFSEDRRANKTAKGMKNAKY